MTDYNKGLGAEIDRLMAKAMEAAKEKRRTIVCEVASMVAVLSLAKVALDVVSDVVTAAELEGLQAWERMSAGAEPDHLGLIPTFIDTSSDKDLATQLNENYQHGGGYPSDAPEWKTKWSYNDRRHKLIYPGDEPLTALWRIQKGDEELIVFDSAVVMVRQMKTGKFVVGRMD